MEFLQQLHLSRLNSTMFAVGMAISLLALPIIYYIERKRSPGNEALLVKMLPIFLFTVGLQMAIVGLLQYFELKFDFSMERPISFFDRIPTLPQHSELALSEVFLTGGVVLLFSLILILYFSHKGERLIAKGLLFLPAGLLMFGLSRSIARLLQRGLFPYVLALASDQPMPDNPSLRLPPLFTPVFIYLLFGAILCSILWRRDSAAHNTHVATALEAKDCAENDSIKR